MTEYDEQNENGPGNPDEENDEQEVTPEAPVPAEPAPVEVTPADQSNVKTDTVLGNDYTVTPEAGYRRS